MSTVDIEIEDVGIDYCSWPRLEYLITLLKSRRTQLTSLRKRGNRTVGICWQFSPSQSQPCDLAAGIVIIPSSTKLGHSALEIVISTGNHNAAVNSLDILAVGIAKTWKVV